MVIKRFSVNADHIGWVHLAVLPLLLGQARLQMFHCLALILIDAPTWILGDAKSSLKKRHCSDLFGFFNSFSYALKTLINQNL